MKTYYSSNGDPVVLVCVGCGKHPDELTCYTYMLEGNQTADEYVFNNEGTLNYDNGHFLCDQCYIDAGMPSSPRGWIAP